MTAMRYFRERIRTTNEKRWVQAWKEEDYPVRPRGRRSVTRLPDDRLDMRPGCLCARSWKRFRKTQYKVKLLNAPAS